MKMFWEKFWIIAIVGLSTAICIAIDEIYEIND